jgi:hypothetical protein
MKRKAIAICMAMLAMTACTKLSVVNAPREKEGISLVLNAHYDAESKIRYMVSNDNSHVYLRFDTDNYGMIMRVRKYGAIIHLDTDGKKKAPFWLKYPVYEQGPQVTPVEDDEMATVGYVQRNLFPPTTAAIWHEGEELRAIDLGVNTENFVCKAGLDSMNVLAYLVGIPFKMLGAERPEDLPNLNVMLEIPSAGAGEKPSGDDMGASGGVPGGNMASSMPGNNNMNSNMPGSMGGMSNSALGTARSSSGPTAIRIWMQVKLSPSAAQ